MKVIITGSEGQLGQVFTRILRDNGCNVIEADIVHKNNDDKHHMLDISCQDSIDKFWSAHYDADCLVNNAGIGVFTPFEDRTVDQIKEVVNVNLIGTLLMIKGFILANKSKNLERHVINIASIYGHISSDFRIYGDSKRNNSEIYTATKAGVIALTKYFAANYAHKGFRFNSISPGGIIRNQSTDFIKNYSVKNPQNRLAEDYEIANVLKFLVLDSPHHLNGEDIRVDGGFAIW